MKHGEYKMTRHTDIFIVGQLYTRLKCVCRLLMLLRGRDKEAFSDEFVSIIRMPMCLRYKERDKRPRVLEYFRWALPRSRGAWKLTWVCSGGDEGMVELGTEIGENKAN